MVSPQRAQDLCSFLACFPWEVGESFSVCLLLSREGKLWGVGVPLGWSIYSGKAGELGAEGSKKRPFFLFLSDLPFKIPASQPCWLLTPRLSQ